MTGSRGRYVRQQLVRQMRGQQKTVGAIVGLVVLAFIVALYIARQERLRLPIDDIYTVKAEFSTGRALTPGQGQSVTVAGVKVGEVSKVTLRNGRALVDLAIERNELPAVYANATMLVRPRTPLQDITIDIDPGKPPAARLGKKVVLPLVRTTPTVNLEEVLAALDSDTRAWLTTMVQGLGDGVRNRGVALRAAWRATAPTLRSARRVSATIAARRREMRRAVASLRDLTAAVARDDRSLRRLVTGGNQTFGALASEDTALRTALDRLPGALHAAETALVEARPLARRTGPALRALVPTARALPATLRRAAPLFKQGTPALQELTKLSREGRPTARALRSGARDLAVVAPKLTETFEVLRYLTNMFAYNPPGKEEGYMFWADWYGQNANSFLSGQDANGPFWRGMIIASCSTLVNNPLLINVFGPALGQLNACPSIPGNAAP